MIEMVYKDTPKDVKIVPVNKRRVFLLYNFTCEPLIAGVFDSEDNARNFAEKYMISDYRIEEYTLNEGYIG